jgi:hypothetical protein
MVVPVAERDLSRAARPHPAARSPARTVDDRTAVLVECPATPVPTVNDQILTHLGGSRR